MSEFDRVLSEEIVEAFQLKNFIDFRFKEWPKWVKYAYYLHKMKFNLEVNRSSTFIDSEEGLDLGSDECDYIINKNGNLYFMKKEKFESTHELIENKPFCYRRLQPLRKVFISATYNK